MRVHQWISACVLLAAGVSAQATSNVAPLGSASQSSLWCAASQCGAAGAIDGSTSGSFYDGPMQHTGTSSGYGVGNGFEWWQVALDQDYLVDSITVWNRTDCCSNRLRSFSVSLWNDGVSVWSGSYTGADGPAPSIDFAGIATVGDTVLVQLDRQDYLHMAEVQVFANPVPEPQTYALMLAGLALVGAAVRRRA